MVVLILALVLGFLTLRRGHRDRAATRVELRHAVVLMVENDTGILHPGTSRISTTIVVGSATSIAGGRGQAISMAAAVRLQRAGTIELQ